MATTARAAGSRSGWARERTVAALGAVVLAVALASLPAQLQPVAVPAGVTGAVAVPRGPAVDVPPTLPLGLTDAAAEAGVPEATEPLPAPVPEVATAPVPAAEPPAPAVPLAGDVQQRVDDALGSLGYPWQELGWSIRFEPYRGGLLGLADPGTRTITVFVKARSTVQQLRVVLAHEIGHALDHRYEEQRDDYRALRGIPADRPWYPCARCDDYDSPAGDFAEVFAAWLVGATDFRSRVAPLPDERQLRELAPLFQPPSARPAAAAPVAPPAPAPSPTPTRTRGLLDLSPR